MAQINDPVLAGFEVRPVVSSNIDYIGLNEKARQLFIQFKNGTSFVYDLSKHLTGLEEQPTVDTDATEDAALWAIFNAEENSPGKVFNAYVKGRYNHTKYAHQLVSHESNS